MEGIDKEVYEHGAKLLGHIIPAELFGEIVALRRKLHETPELAFQEERTAKVVRDELASIEGVLVLPTPAGGTGVIAVIEGGIEGAGKTVLFRADLDGLPIQEVHEVPRPQSGDGSGGQTRVWRKHTCSKKPGVSHACGHDGHVAMLVGAAKVIASKRALLRGRLVLLFQPAEERHSARNPMGGAIRMIRDKAAGEELCKALGVPVVTRPQVDPSCDEDVNNRDGRDDSMDQALLDGIDEVYGAHLWNCALSGTVGCSAGSVTANSDSLDINVTGTGGHASAPQGTVDAVVVAAQLVTALQAIVSRNLSPTESGVITVGKIEGGCAPNVIASRVRLMGTVRTFTPAVKALMRERIDRVAAGIAASHGPNCAIEVKFSDGYPACVNDGNCAEAVLSAARTVLPRGLVGPPTPNMAGEDFAFFLSRKPGAFFFVGSNPDLRFGLDPSEAAEVGEVHNTGMTTAHHTPEFDIHEGALWCGAAMWVGLAEGILKA